MQRYQVKPYTWNPFFPVNTLNLMRAAVAAEFGAYSRNTSRLRFITWGEPKKMDDPEVAVRLRLGLGIRRRSGQIGRSRILR